MHVGSGTSTSIPRRFEQQVERSPDAIALEGIEGRLTYAQLNARAEVIAASLRDRGVVRGSIVVNLLPRTFDMVAASIGILKAGAAYCPLDPLTPAARIQMTLEDTRPKLIICAAQVKTELALPDEQTLCIDQIDFSRSVAPVRVDVGTDEPACVMFTSGSTGRPKGALIPHQGIWRLLVSSSYVLWGPHIRSLSIAPLQFDASTFEMWGPLLHGGVCALFSGGAIPTLHEFKSDYSKHRVNFAFLGPATFNLMIDVDPDILTGLKYVVVGGDALSVPHMRKAMARFPDTQFVNGYGPTEATTFATTYQIPHDLPADAHSVPIGVPLPETECYLLDESKLPVPDGDMGELYIGGAGVALGYLNRPDLTAERFIEDTFSGTAGARLYRTGDQCRRLPDGNIEFLGRNDHQVKINGNRVELSEIEIAAMQHPAVAQCVVVVREAGADRQLAAYFTVLKGQACSVGELRERLRTRLPAFMMPHWLVRMDRIPITPNGKVDRRQLPDPTAGRVDASGEAMSDLQAKLLPLFRSALGSEQAGPEDCFFELGGTSLGAMRLCSLIQLATGRFIPIDALARHSTVASMESYLQSAKPGVVCPIQKPTLFCAPGVTGHSIPQLAERMNQYRPTVCLQFPGFEADCPLPRTVEEIADLFIGQVHEMAGESIHLLGYSFGGVVAWEMAARLKRLGVRVRSIVLLDAYTSAAVRRKRALARLRIHGQYLVRHGPALIMETARVKWNKLRGNYRKSSGDPEYDRRAWRIWDANSAAFESYSPRPWGGNVLLLKCAEQPPSMQLRHNPERNGWDSLVTTPLTFRTIPGSHTSMLDGEHVDALTQMLNQWLDAND